MRTASDRFSAAHEAQPDRIRDIILEELVARINTPGRARAERYRLLKLIMIRDFAAGTWSEGSRSRGASDVGLVAIVSHKALTGMSAFWDEVEVRLSDELQLNGGVSIIVHTLQEVNRQLKDGQCLFSEIITQGILLHEDSEPDRNGVPKNCLARFNSLDPQRVNSIGRANISDWKIASRQAMFLAKVCLSKGEDWNRRSAFQLHQAAECAYRMFLLGVTFYTPGTHDLGRLRKLACIVDSRLEEVWGPPEHPHSRYFDLLRNAYVEARYSHAYETSRVILTWQAECVEKLIEVADVLCVERLNRLKAEGACFLDLPVIANSGVKQATEEY